MAQHEYDTHDNQEIELNPTVEDFSRGRIFVEGLVALKAGMKELGLMPENAQRFSIRSGFYMVIVPSEPIYRKTIAYKYHKDPGLSRDEMSLDPFQITYLKINGLYDLTSRDILEIEGGGPIIPSSDAYEAHYWRHIYTFDPRQHQIAIINPAVT